MVQHDIKIENNIERILANPLQSIKNAYCRVGDREDDRISKYYLYYCWLRCCGAHLTAIKKWAQANTVPGFVEAMQRWQSIGARPAALKDQRESIRPHSNSQACAEELSSLYDD